MIEYKTTPPNLNEIEIILFGPGFGEAIAVHLGDGKWLLVDSCIEPNTTIPASQVYLDSIGVNPNQVLAIVASHWHDDHVRGISQLSSNYPNAEFIISSVFNDKEASAFITAFNNQSASGLSRGTKELYSAVKNRSSILHASHRTIVVEETLNNRSVIVTALSPVSAAVSQSLVHMAQYLPSKGKAINNAPELPQNLEAVALHIDFGDDAILLGSDLEEHNSFGWTAVINDSWSGRRRRSSIYKHAHHGSKSSECGKIWTQLLENYPIACLTPWILAGNRLPTDDDINRIKSKSRDSYIASVTSRSPKMERDQLKRLNDIGSDVKLVDTALGAVRLRKTIGTPIWNVTLFGSAQKL